LAGRYVIAAWRTNATAQAASILIVAAIILWNTVYMERAIAALRGHGIEIEDESLADLSPKGWEHINLTGDYTWQATERLRKGKFRPLRPVAASNE
jgi:hypothetical protein